MIPSTKIIKINTKNSICVIPNNTGKTKANTNITTMKMVI
jgi:hypothetical protein